MEERGGKTIMCSVLFLDIAEYSKRSVAGQISLKDRFNGYLSEAISSVPINDRIILDTGDGAAINFLGDVEDALKAALSLRESILKEGPDIDPPLLVRMGINLGPVRLVRDINGQPNIVGDGINVAQRIMGFAEAGQIFVSRSYYDAVSRLSPQYNELFHFQGSRTDKHVRDHEVYAIRHPDDKTPEILVVSENVEEGTGLPARMLASVKTVWNSAALGLNGVAESALARFKQATPLQRALYAGAVVLPVLLVGLLVLKRAHNGEAPIVPSADQVQAASGIQPESAVVSAAASAVPGTLHAESKTVGAGAPHAESKVAGTGKTQPVAKLGTSKPPEGKPEAKKSVEVKHEAKKSVEIKPDAKKSVEAKTDSGGEQAAHPKVEPVHKADAPTGAGGSAAEHSSEARLSITCDEGTQIFVDGSDKGKVVSTGLTVAVSPGKHKIIVASKKGTLHSQDVDLVPGKTIKLKPKFCD